MLNMIRFQVAHLQRQIADIDVLVPLIRCHVASIRPSHQTPKTPSDLNAALLLTGPQPNDTQRHRPPRRLLPHCAGTVTRNCPSMTVTRKTNPY
jgi:hypothetical protein